MSTMESCSRQPVFDLKTINDVRLLLLSQLSGNYGEEELIELDDLLDELEDEPVESEAELLEHDDIRSDVLSSQTQNEGSELLGDANLQNREAINRRRLWLQFCEGIVSDVESSPEASKTIKAILASNIVRLRGIEGYQLLISSQPELRNHIVSNFRALHEEFVGESQSLGPMCDIDVEEILEREQTNPEEDIYRMLRDEYKARLHMALARAATDAIIEE
ncbi:hypothetical protein ACLMJK_001329 [Lecanora helva]